MSGLFANLNINLWHEVGTTHFSTKLVCSCQLHATPVQQRNPLRLCAELLDRRKVSGVKVLLIKLIKYHVNNSPITWLMVKTISDSQLPDVFKKIYSHCHTWKTEWFGGIAHIITLNNTLLSCL